ncbi:MAG: hypothetical protein H8D92_01355 [Pelagibacteraceae bacterium]|jgi:hypothetical protein|nr:hypothetical protein [Pelagibacteraceae bacterium]
MVEFEVEDYTTILNWFELAFANNDKKISVNDKRVLWKLTFLCEDKIEEQRMAADDNESEHK